MNKRGLSLVITTLILIVLVLVAVGIIWVVVNNILKGGTEGIALGKFTLDAEIKNVNIDNSSNNVSLTVKRNPGKGELNGIKFIFYDGTESEIITEEEITLKELEQRRFYFHLININVDNLIRVSIVPIFKTDSEKEIMGNIIDVYDVSDKEPVCGNNIREATEICDGTDLSGENCTSQGFVSGNLGCYPTGHVQECTFDTSGCSMIACNPHTCAGLNYECGTHANGTCPGTLNCGTCGLHTTCPSGTCICDSGWGDCNNNNSCDCDLSSNSCVGGSCVEQLGTVYYVDPDWAGTEHGTESQPFSVLDNTAWTTINTALASGNVIIYFSAREAGLDTNEDYGAGIQIYDKKTANPGNSLTLYGNSKYNTNDLSPNWQDYFGNSKHIIKNVISQNGAHTKYNDITIKGFEIARDSSGKAVSICGDNWIVENNEIYHTASVSDGPLIMIVPTADSAHEGTSYWCEASTNIIIKDNIIHDSYGEIIYVGAGGLNPGEAGSGYPSHSNITISGNTIYNGGVYGGQGDGIDMKGGLTNVMITGNEIYNINDIDIRGIVMQGQESGGVTQNIIIEKNYIHDIPNSIEGISLSNSWGNSKGVEIRNNIIDTVNSEGITIYSGSATEIMVYNNIIYNCGQSGIRVDSGNTVIVKNNALLDNNLGGNQATLSGIITSTNNAYSNTWSGTCTDCVSNLLSSDFSDIVNNDFTIPNTSSKLYDLGITISSFSDDYDGTSRPQGSAWDIGAYEYVA